MKSHLWEGVCALVLLAGPAYADVWDTRVDHDNGSGTDTELMHGTIQTHDLGALPGPVADQDWYVVYVPPYSSFEVVVDNITGDLNLYQPGAIQRLDVDGTTVLQNAEGASAGWWSMRLAWLNITAKTQMSYVRVQGASCGTSCTSADQYRIVGRDTTVFVARFNNSGSQLTVLLAQNASADRASAFFFYWSSSGVQLVTSSCLCDSKALLALNTTVFPQLVGQSGHITIAHDAPYGMLNVKAVALEPSTGFSFDTPGVVRTY